MPYMLLATKLYVPPARPELVSRPRLTERLNAGLRNRLTLISAPAGFGKTTLVSEWVAGAGRPVAWLSLDEGDSDPTRFAMYLIAALQTIAAHVGAGVMGALQSAGAPITESILTALLNDISALPDDFTLVLDDYHVMDGRPADASTSADEVLTFLLEHLPPQMHLVIASREDPRLPLARLRARGQLTELRAADLRFTPAEAAEFLNRVMGLELSAGDISALDTRTEGWIAGLHLAALALQGTLATQGQQDPAGFIQAFAGSHRFVLDYLLEEVLQQQADRVQTFLLRTSILERLCGPLCEAVCPNSSGQETLEYLERTNLFIVPLDSERRWYRYHHLFAGFLRQRLGQRTDASTGDAGNGVAECHIRASAWYEANGLELEAFQHAAAANDVERAERLMDGKGMPLHFRGAVAPVLNWLKSLPTTVLDANPSLWTTYASVLLVSGQPTAAEQRLQAAEAALNSAGHSVSRVEGAVDRTQDTLGRIAAIRATLALNQYQVDAGIAQSKRALEYLHPSNLSFRTFTIWKLGYAYDLQGNRAAASQAYTEALAISQASGNTITTIAAMLGLGGLQESENQLHLAARTYRQVLPLFGDQPLPLANRAHLGLARIAYQWNDLDAAQQHGQQSAQLARQSENPHRLVLCEVFLARLRLARQDVAGAAALLAEAEQSVRQHSLARGVHEVAAAQVLVLLRQGDLAAAAHLAQAQPLSISRARVYLAQGDTSAACDVLDSLRQQMESKGWVDERLKVMALQAVALQAQGERDRAVQVLGEALALAEPGGPIRLFVDEGLPMARLLAKAAALGMAPDYANRLLAAFEAEQPSVLDESAASSHKSEDRSDLLPASLAQALVEPLSQRELEILELVAQGLSNREIGQRLYLALDTVKGHNRRIFQKLLVHSRTEATARARELGLL